MDGYFENDGTVTNAGSFTVSAGGRTNNFGSTANGGSFSVESGGVFNNFCNATYTGNIIVNGSFWEVFGTCGEWVNAWSFVPRPPRLWDALGAGWT